ncbi:MAG: methyltransferase family protein [Candidatus Hermodarchaeota archaeon]
MRSNHHGVMGKEYPHTDKINIICGIIFLIVWIIDSFILNLSTGLNAFIPLIARIILFIIFLILAIIFGVSSHNALFNEKYETATLLKTGVFAHVRHPLYLSILLAYLALFFLTFSLISFIIWSFIFILYNKMATYEEKDLEKIFGEDYGRYRKNVPKWIPRLFAAKNEN